MTPSPLRVLIVADDPACAGALADALCGEFVPEVARAGTEPEFLAHLAAPPDVVLCPYAHPQLPAFRALDLIRDRGAAVPLVVVSDPVGECAAADVVLHGAADFVPRARIDRLAAAVRRALDRRPPPPAPAGPPPEMGRDLQQIFDAVPALIFYKDLEHRFVRVNEEVVRFLGLPREAILGRTDYDLGLPLAAQYARDEDAVAATGRPRQGIVELVTTPAGKRWLQTDKLPHRDAAGRVIGVIGFATDVTERKEAEEAARQAQERLQHVIASSPAVLYKLAIEGERIRGIAWVSENVREVLGYSPGETAGKGWLEATVHPDDADRAVAAAERGLIARGRYSTEFRIRHRSGEYRSVRSDVRLVLDATGESVEAIGSWSDVTEWRRVEDQYRQAQKMEAFGQLAAGVAHDFNNLLTIINGYCDLLLDELQDADPRRASAGEIREAGGRAAALTAQLLAFSRKTILEPKVIDLNDLVRRTGKMLERTLGEDVALRLALAPGLDRVKADRGQLEQVVVNLAVNARDAMPTGGRLTIETRNVEVAPGDRRFPDLRPGPYAQLSVGDTGVGMTDEVRAKIFEPFFTTKGVGKGTGLGLATVYGIVAQARGRIDVATAVGAGTTFSVLFPAAAHEDAAAPAATPAPVARGTETLLLVEDEPAVRRFARRSLEALGYAVLEAGNGAEALRAADAHAGPIHLLVTDVVMPEMGGRDLAEAVRGRRPEARVLFVSGYTDDAVVRNGVVQATDAFLQKPFSPVALARKVRATLDAAR
ncbi:response regulator [Gemmata sp.]|uniref:hybrid sensor histidine kinase/response regulator n=1 Tax=Gemmata sp. TaxID=1914242 RepID=UPI003F6E50D7